MFKRFLCVSLAVIMAAAMFGCSGVNGGNNSVQNASFINTAGKSVPIRIYTSGEEPGAEAEYNSLFTEANTDFAIRMINAADVKDTCVFSPLSLQTALLMLANGGDEKTAKDLLDSVVPGMTKDEVNNSGTKLISLLTSAEGFGMSNTVIANCAYEVNRKFAQTVGDCYRASVGALDFSDPSKATREVNKWISQNTNEQINDLLDDLGQETVMVLLNALTLKLDWKTPFMAMRELSEFHGSKGVESVGMIQSSSTVEYGAFDQGEIVIVPYKGGDFNMAVMLPKEGLSPAEAAAALIERINDCKTEDVLLKMPKVELNTKLDIIPMAEKLGIDSGINGVFSELVSNENATVDTILQGASLSVTEYGTMATAATAIVTVKGGMVPANVSVVCDRPYAMAIYHVETGTVLFVSLVNDVG